MIERRPALGKGLSALIPTVSESPRQGPLEIDIDLLAPGDQQPRLIMDDGKLEELAQSIKANGIIQPILVRRTGATYRIIAGERRWRAAQRAGLLKVPVIVRDMPEGSERQLLELAALRSPYRDEQAHVVHVLVALPPHPDVVSVAVAARVLARRVEVAMQPALQLQPERGDSPLLDEKGQPRVVARLPRAMVTEDQRDLPHYCGRLGRTHKDVERGRDAIAA